MDLPLAQKILIKEALKKVKGTDIEKLLRDAHLID